uniref:Uncharacterized protein n=1 Tax=virus sp. ctPYc18 TaxID=2828251 RepID=A0A8S5RCJ1_9VIRU|nr:MAG TPA: hypothetical protein [virus sp. ctPYc18]
MSVGLGKYNICYLCYSTIFKDIYSIFITLSYQIINSIYM